MYWNGIKCSPKLKYGQTCTNVFLNECLDSELTFCNSNFRCECITGQYFDTIKQICQNQIGEFGNCFPSMIGMCISPMTCRENYKCMCDDDEFFDDNYFQCITKYLNGFDCDDDHQCAQSKGLTCQDNKCLCLFPRYTWSWTSKACKLTYNSVGCINDNDCNEEEKLVCRTSGENCYKNTTGYFCDCSRSINNEFYWDGSECLKAKSYKSYCKNDCQCQTLTQLTYCKNNVCQCNDDLEGGFLNNQCRYCSTNEFYFNQLCYYISNSGEKAKYSKSCNNKEIAKVLSNDILNTFKTKITESDNFWVYSNTLMKSYCNVTNNDPSHWKSEAGCLSSSIKQGSKLRYICQRELN